MPFRPTRPDDENNAQLQARRRFLRRCGKFAAITPPAITLMLSMSDRGYAQFQSGGGPVGSPGGGNGNGHPHRHGHHRHHHGGHGRRQGNNGFGNGGHDGVPGRSGFSDRDR